MHKDPSKYSLTSLAKMLKEALQEFNNNDPLRMAGATAFFTTFALPPILIILIQTLGLIFNPQKISKQLFEALSGIIQTESVHQIVHTLTAFRKLAQNWYITIGGFIFLLFVATTLFKVINGSINQLWRIRIVKQRNFFAVFRTRVQAVLVILVAGVLFVFSLLTSGLQAYLGKYLHKFSPALSFYFDSGLNYLFSVIIVTVWFAIVFRYLPDGRPKWKVALTGALVTSLLFNTGKVVLRWLLVSSNINTVYGASGSIVLLLLFVFYSSLILYYGATFTKIWGEWHKKPITALPHAVPYKVSEL